MSVVLSDVRARRAEARFLVTVAEALHRLGMPAWSLEPAITQAAEALGERVECVASPTSLVLAIGPRGDQQVVVFRIGPGEVDLGRLSTLDRLIRSVAEGETDVGSARRELRRALAAPTVWGPCSDIAAFAVASGGAGVLFGGAWADVVVATALGVIVGLMAMASIRSATAGRMLLVGAAALATVLPRVLMAWGHVELHPSVVTVSGLIALVPGLSLTVAMTELANAHLVAGVARAAGAVMALLSLAVGVALGDALIGAAPVLPVLALPAWTTWVAAATGGVAFAVLLRADPRDLGIVTLAGVVGFAAGDLAGRWFDPVVGSGIASLALGLASNGWARWRDRPVMIPLVPGLLVLVPGSVGFRSVSALLGGDVLLGIEHAFRTGSVAMALAAGVVLAQGFLPPRRSI